MYNSFLQSCIYCWYKKYLHNYGSVFVFALFNFKSCVQVKMYGMKMN